MTKSDICMNARFACLTKSGICMNASLVKTLGITILSESSFKMLDHFSSLKVFVFVHKMTTLTYICKTFKPCVKFLSLAILASVIISHFTRKIFSESPIKFDKYHTSNQLKSLFKLSKLHINFNQHFL